MFSKQLIDYTESTFKESKIEILTKTMVKEVCLLVQRQAGPVDWPDSWLGETPERRAADARQNYCRGSLRHGCMGCRECLSLTSEADSDEWCTQGNTGRKVTRDLMARFPSAQTNKRGITVDGSTLSV